MKAAHAHDLNGATISAMRKLAVVLAIIALSGCGASTGTTSSDDPTTVSPVTTVADADVWRGELADRCVGYSGQDALDCICRAQLIAGEMTRSDYDLAMSNKRSRAAEQLDGIYRRCQDSQ